MDRPVAADGSTPQPGVETLFDQLCLRWAREAELVLRERGAVTPTLVLLPRDVGRDEVAVSLEGLRGNLAERGATIVAEVRPQVAGHDPAGLVFLTESRVGAGDQDGVAVYVSLGRPGFRRVLAYTRGTATDGMPALTRTADPDLRAFVWLDELLRPERSSG